jgi:hypothetical protein
MQDNQDSGAHQGTSPRDGSLPFFARFLEGQNSTASISATLKFPSDLDEMDHTMKYPSDSDEGDVD